MDRFASLADDLARQCGLTQRDLPTAGDEDAEIAADICAVAVLAAVYGLKPEDLEILAAWSHSTRFFLISAGSLRALVPNPASMTIREDAAIGLFMYIVGRVRTGA